MKITYTIEDLKKILALHLGIEDLDTINDEIDYRYEGGISTRDFLGFSIKKELELKKEVKQ